MKLKKFDSVAIWSPTWRDLADWYKEIFDLKENMTLDLPDDTGTNLIVGDESVLFWFGYHDKVEGKNKDPHRIMIAFTVDDVYEMETYLKEKGVTIISKAQIAPTEDFHVLTIQDPEDNIINLYSFPEDT